MAETMSLLASTDDAEQVAHAWMEKRYGSRLGKVKFVEVMSENGTWTVKANVKLAAGLLAFKPYLIQLKIDSNTTDVLGYSETEVSSKPD
jgi:hypothetical protein